MRANLLFVLKYHETASYLGSANVYLYASTTGSTKYDQHFDNTKQLWVLNKDCNIDVHYDTPVKLMDRYVFSHMAVNTTTCADDYTGGNSKVWVEAKYDRHVEKNFRCEFVFQRAEQTSTPNHRAPESSVSKSVVWAPVRLGKKVVVPVWATHWAVQVDTEWYEVSGASKSDSDVPNEIKRQFGSNSEQCAVPVRGGLIGNTKKSQQEIDEWLQWWLHQHPKYNFKTTNCQKFAKDFVDFLCDGKAKLPMMEAGTRSIGQGPAVWAAASNGTAIAEATTGRREAQQGIAKIATEGPNANAKALWGNEGYGAFAHASAGRVDAGLGGVGLFIEPNISMGAGFHSGNAEVKVLGFGGKVGADGLEVSTPLGGGRCEIM